jgi:hypothetical protein
MELNTQDNGGEVKQVANANTNNFKWSLFVVALVVIIFGAWFFTSRESEVAPESANEAVVEVVISGKYQAVFLDSGQVYFGKLKKSNKIFYSLTDVFYLKTGTVGLDKVSNLSLTKLGGEAHGPEDKMEINVSHILFIENMRSDSKVVSAINQYKTNNN